MAKLAVKILRARYGVARPSKLKVWLVYVVGVLSGIGLSYAYDYVSTIGMRLARLESFAAAVDAFLRGAH